jgi:hypothetical protein
MIRAVFVLAFVGLAGCGAEPAYHAATADQVMAAQYHADGTQGAMSGKEAETIDRSYLQQLAVEPGQSRRVSDQRGENKF